MFIYFLDLFYMTPLMPPGFRVSYVLLLKKDSWGNLIGKRRSGTCIGFGGGG